MADHRFLSSSRQCCLLHCFTLSLPLKKQYLRSFISSYLSLYEFWQHHFFNHASCYSSEDKPSQATFYRPHRRQSFIEMGCQYIRLCPPNTESLRPTVIIAERLFSCCTIFMLITINILPSFLFLLLVLLSYVLSILFSHLRQNLYRYFSILRNSIA
jgi:hypothetical protein